MHDLPEQQPDGEPCIEMVDTIDSIKETDQITHHGLTFSISEALVISALEKPPAPTKPISRENKLQDLLSLAHYLKSPYPLGFSWEQLPKILIGAIPYIEPSMTLSPIEKREAVLQTLLFVAAQTDVPHLPEGINDSTFTTLLPPFVNLAFEVRTGKFIFSSDKAIKIVPFRKEKPTKERLEIYARNIRRLWMEEVTWNNLAHVARLGLAFMLTFKDLSQEEIRQGVETVMFTFIDHVPSSALPSDYNERHFKAFFLSLNKDLVNQIAVQNNHKPDDHKR